MDVKSGATFFDHVKKIDCDMDVSENSGFSPQIIHFNRVFHYKPSILGAHPYFWKPPYAYMKMIQIVLMLYAQDTSTYYFILLLFASLPRFIEF